MAKAKWSAQELFDMFADMTLTATIGKREGDPRSVQYALTDLPLNAIEYIVRYGGQRAINDKCGGSDTTVEDKHANASAIVERFKAGDIGRAVAAGVDAVTSLARSKARAAFKKAYKDTPEWRAFSDKDKIGQNTVLDAIVEKNPHFREEAEKEIAARAKATTRVEMDGIEL